MKVVGIDFSLTGTGVCAIEDGEAECATFRSKPGDSWWSHPARVQSLAASVSEWVDDVPAWAIESPSFRSSGPGHDKVLSGWWLFIDHLMRECGWEAPLRVAPTQVKKFAVGKGGGPDASKVGVALAIARRFPDVTISNDNESDALVLAAIGAAAFGEPFMQALTKPQSEVVAAVVSKRLEK